MYLRDIPTKTIVILQCMVVLMMEINIVELDNDLAKRI